MLDNVVDESQFFRDNPSIEVYYNTLRGNVITLSDYSFELIEAYEKMDNNKADEEGFIRFQYEYRNSSRAENGRDFSQPRAGMPIIRPSKTSLL